MIFNVLDKAAENDSRPKMNTVEVRGAYKYYGKPKDPKIVLNKLHMTVSPGSM
jgi:hypothetical protein